MLPFPIGNIIFKNPSMLRWVLLIIILGIKIYVYTIYVKPRKYIYICCFILLHCQHWTTCQPAFWLLLIFGGKRPGDKSSRKKNTRFSADFSVKSMHFKRKNGWDLPHLARRYSKKKATFDSNEFVLHWMSAVPKWCDNLVACGSQVDMCVCDAELARSGFMNESAPPKKKSPFPRITVTRSF